MKHRLRKFFDFVYKAEFENGLTEHEFDHVFAGEYDGELNVDPEEVKDYSYKDVLAIQSMLQQDPQKFTAWFIIAFPKIEEWWKNRYANTTIVTS